MKKSNRKSTLESKNIIQLVLIGSVILLFIISITLTLRMSERVDDLQAKAREAAQPAKLEITVLLSGSCGSCDAQITETLRQIQKNANVTKENTILMNKDAVAAQKYVEEYSIEYLPALIVSGETEKASLSGFEERNNAQVFETNTPPYMTGDGEIVGLVTASLLVDESCDECADANAIVATLLKAGVTIDNVDEITYQSTAGKKIIASYDLTQVPTIILSHDIEAYPEVASAVESLGRRGTDGSYIIEDNLVPFRDLSDGEIRGFVDVIYLGDASCDECYDVQLHKQILARLGVKIGEERTIDIGDEESAALLKTYNIVLVPTIILSSDAGYYPALSQAWSGVGSIEEDGAYVFRKVDAMGTAKNLETGEVITK